MVLPQDPASLVAERQLGWVVESKILSRRTRVVRLPGRSPARRTRMVESSRAARASLRLVSLCCFGLIDEG
eukprot:scaffold4672_cov168-Pinguiococcus_pyrenoidosus.AAC.1